MRARMESGFWIHNPPVGYRYETEKGRGKVLVPNPPFDAIIREAFEGYATGRFQTHAEVKRFFESFPDFPRTKHGEVTRQRVADILSHPIYTRHICSETYGIHRFKAQHAPLISMATFEKAQQRREGVAKAPRRKNIVEDFALRGIVTCAECKVPLRSSWSTARSGKRHPYYLCQTKGCSCYGKFMRRAQVEGDVGELLKSLQPTPGLITLARAMFRQAWDQRLHMVTEAQAAARAKLTSFDAQINAVLDRIMASTNTTVISTYEKKIAHLEKEKALLTEQTAQQRVPAGSFDEKLEPLLAFLARPWKIWGNGTTKAKQLVLKLAFASRIEYARNEGPRTPELSLPFKA